MTILLSGSLAFDRLASFPGHFKDNLLKERLDILNASFLVDRVVRVHGGTAGNIAYNLSLLGERPLVISSLGNDPDGLDYLERLRGWGLSLEAIRVDPELPSPGAYIATDLSNSQFIFFHPGAMAAESPFDPGALGGDPKGRLAMISPGCLSDMKRLAKAYRGLGIPFIFDPGQQIPAFAGEELKGMLRGSEIFVTNEYELELFLGICGLRLEELFSETKAVLTTLGERGSLIRTPAGETRIPAVAIKAAKNPTGAGDAYRAGLLKGLTMGFELLDACRLGATVAAFCVESDGTQGHGFGLGEFRERHREAFPGARPI
jgi:adenosine kinase